ncbi:hypothetical protein CONPUDRAFT_70379 [Coniophora puteana RWD-64-598 SS2]|uniref:Uncharacterized protein n=1 Tax=Coniophora puteana (strain RWD-64-598) TaxID=741705 RepID=A0A5M3N2L8_CONPW|nr:uncharacterized protein CONPUDRAFT_70379 [Coniophora puteana RWD-64-598 SS2]EIW85618.1 hypothetical protein CONPUDRAFT_70379 [Coniophora puteana RWD-64-598 SS2]
MPEEGEAQKKWKVDSTLECLNCNEIITVGFGGTHSLKEHQRSKRCREEVRKRKEAEEPSKPKGITLFSLGVKKVAGSVMKRKSTTKTASAVDPPKAPTPSTSSSPTPSASTSVPAPTNPPCPEALALIQRLRAARRGLPATVEEVSQETTTIDGPQGLAAVVCCRNALAALPEAEVWENLDPMLNKIMGGDSKQDDLQALVRIGPLGLDGFIEFLEFVVIQRGIKGGLLEGKLTRFISAMEALPGYSAVSGPSVCAAAPLVVDLTRDDEEMLIPAAAPRCPVPVVALPPPLRPRLPCSGYTLAIPDSKTAASGYPLGLHDEYDLPWSVRFWKNTICLHADECIGLTDDGETCACCNALPGNMRLQGIMERMSTGVHKNAPHAYRSFGELREVVRQKTVQLDHMRVGRMNARRRLARKLTALADFKKFIMAAAKGEVNRLDALLRVCMKRRMSPKAMLALLDKALCKVYKPKSFTEAEKLRGLVMLRLGGARVADIAHRSSDSPAVSTLRHHSCTRPIQISPRTPTQEEIRANIQASVPDVNNSPNKETHLGKGSRISLIDAVDAVDVAGDGYSIMVDEIKTELRVRWDEQTNMIVGVGREDADKLELEFSSIAEVEALWEAVRTEHIHLASEATVAAIGHIPSSPHSRMSACPILVSGTCKREDAVTHSRLLQTIIDACRAESVKLAGRLYSLASDGETRRGAALVMLTMKKKLTAESNIYRYVGLLKLMNSWVGDDDITADKDWKHVFKRLRNLLLRLLGVHIFGVSISTQSLREHLTSTKTCTETQADAYTDPNDKQDVPLAFNFLKRVWEIPPPSDNDEPTVYVSRVAIRRFGLFLRYLLAPYITPTMSLHEQLVSLSAAAHLALLMYVDAGPGNDFMPKTLYQDIQIMIKNVYYSVAKAKVDKPGGNFYIISLGTDRLEQLFGIYRTMIGSDANVDILQLALRIANVAEVGKIMVKYPEWDVCPRRLKTPSLNASAELSSKIDHLNPASWLGDTSLAPVQPLTAWNEGRRLIEQEFSDLGAVACFERVEATPDADMMFPWGNSRIPTEVPVPESPEEENSDEKPTDQPTLIPAPSMDLDLEEYVSENLPPATTASAAKVNPHILVEGKPVFKPAVLCLFFQTLNSSGSTDRLKRVAGLTRFPIPEKDIISTTSALGDERLVVNDPAFTVVRCNGRIFLALMQVNLIMFRSKSVGSIAERKLHEDSVELKGQLMILREHSTPIALDDNADNDDENSELYDWRWSGALDKNFKTLGRFAQIVDATVSTAVIGQPTYFFRTPELSAIAASLYAQVIPDDRQLLPSIPQTDTFPYRVASGRAAFLCETESADTQLERDGNCCPRCGPRHPWNRKSGPRVLEHVGAHILFDPSLDKTAELCGMCGNNVTLSGCVFFLRKPKGSGTSIQVHHKRSRCTNYVKFSYQPANVSVACPLCPDDKPAVWKYSIEAHIRLHHNLNTPSARDLINSCVLTVSENAGMLGKWTTRYKHTRLSKKSKPSQLLVSDAHSAAAATSYDDDDVDTSSVNRSGGEDDDTSTDTDIDTEPGANVNDIPNDDGYQLLCDDEENAAGPSGSGDHNDGDDENIFTLEGRPTRSGRIRRARDMSDIHACYCMDTVMQAEIDANIAVRCTGRGLPYEMCDDHRLYIKMALRGLSGEQPQAF